MEGLRFQSGLPRIGTTYVGMIKTNPFRNVVGFPQLPWRKLSARCNGMVVGDGAAVVLVAEEEKSENWIDGMLEVVENDCSCFDDADSDDEKDGERIEFDSNLFSRFLKRVNLSDAKMFAQLSYLSMLAYCIPKIKAKKLVNSRGLTYVTSSLEKKELLSLTERGQSDQTGMTTQTQESYEKPETEDSKNGGIGYFINASAAYDIASSAAAYLHSQTKSLLPFSSTNDEDNELVKNNDNSSIDDDEVNKSSVKAVTNAVTSVISSEEEVKQSVADDLSSIVFSPCEWFICDDKRTATRYFIIQGSESLASWQTNLLFEPVQFEGLDALVHRGIYEAAKGMYDQMLPEIHSHLKSHGDRATLRFSGHSLGGSLAMLVNLMLLIRGEVTASCLLPVVTFGAPYIMGWGNKLLAKLGLPKNHVQSLILHRDVVPRAFSAELPSHAVDLLKAVNGNFRNHPCLNKQNIMYDPMGQMLILQPDPRLSPPHSLLPPGSGLYLLTPASNKAKKYLRSAQLFFLNTPHPLEILSDRAAYGTEGSISRDHDMRSYLKAIRVVIRYELNQIKKSRTEQRNKDRWPLVSPRSRISGGQPVGSTNLLHQQEHVKFSGPMYNGKQTLKRFSRLVASQHIQMFLLLLVPVRFLLVSAYNVLSFS